MIDVAGSTLGCFGDGCSTFSSPVAYTSEDYHLVFDGTSFFVTTDASGASSDFSLGSMTRGGVNTDEDAPSLDFTLQVTFTLPTGISGGQADVFTALITGTSANGGGGPTPIDFDNEWRLYVFSSASGTGSFEFRVANDPAVNKNSTKSGNGAEIFGSIRYAAFTPVDEIETSPPANDVPEPASLALFGFGAAALAWRRRQRVP